MFILLIIIETKDRPGMITLIVKLLGIINQRFVQIQIIFKCTVV